MRGEWRRLAQLVLGYGILSAAAVMVAVNVVARVTSRQQENAIRRIVATLAKGDRTELAAALKEELADGCIEPSPYAVLLDKGTLFNAERVTVGHDSFGRSAYVLDGTKWVMVSFEHRSPACRARTDMSLRRIEVLQGGSKNALPIWESASQR